jgi:hypothetical protein
MNKLSMAMSILTNAGLLPAAMPPLPISQTERLHKYHDVVLEVETLFGKEVVSGDVVSHLTLSDYCALNKARIVKAPSFYSEALPTETSSLL